MPDGSRFGFDRSLLSFQLSRRVTFGADCNGSSLMGLWRLVDSDSTARVIESAETCGGLMFDLARICMYSGWFGPGP